MTSKVADLIRNQPDSAGVIVEQIYIKVSELYAVYRTDERVVIQFADDPALGAEQRKSLIDLALTRGAIDSLLAEMRDTRDHGRLKRAQRYERRLADALTLALQGQTNQATAELDSLKQHLVEERKSYARRTYLLTSVAAGAGLILLIAVLSSSLFNFGVPAGHRAVAASMWFAAAVGTVGAFFWTAIAVSNREIEPSVSLWDTASDAGLRMFVGALSGALIFALIRAKAFGITIGSAVIDGNSARFLSSGADWLLVLLVAFVAGFMQRLVPDMLAKATASEVTQVKAPVSHRSAAEDARSTEQNPRGDAAGAGAPAAAPLAEPAEEDQDDPEQDEDDCSNRPGAPELLTQDVELPEALGGVEDARPAG